MHVRYRALMNERKPVCMDACKEARMYVWACEYVHVGLCAWMFVYAYVCRNAHVRACMYACLHVCMSACMSVV